MVSMTIEHLAIYNENKQLVNLLLNFDTNLTINSSLALVGQSGSGKSLTLKTILNLLPDELNVEFKYTSDFELKSNNIGFIPQNPFTSLSPMTKISKQFFCEESKVNELLELVQLPNSTKTKFPMQLSGGQLQRVVIAIALSNNPKILLLDEPTTALDENSKKNILDLLISIQQELNFIFIFVSHDIDSIKNICEDIAILKDGKIVEYGKTINILNNPVNNYTKELIRSNFKNREYRI